MIGLGILQGQFWQVNHTTLMHMSTVSDSVRERVCYLLGCLGI